jgi:hypothetical protein
VNASERLILEVLTAVELCKLLQREGNIPTPRRRRVTYWLVY